MNRRAVTLGASPIRTTRLRLGQCFAMAPEPALVDVEDDGHAELCQTAIQVWCERESALRVLGAEYATEDVDVADVADILKGTRPRFKCINEDRDVFIKSLASREATVE